MKKAPLYFTLLSVLLLYSCWKTEISCTIEAQYWGDFVCLDNELAAAVSLNDSNNSYLILSNFFEWVDPEEIHQGDPIIIEYSPPDSSLFNSGILCGALIVAPIATLECFQLP